MAIRRGQDTPQRLGSALPPSSRRSRGGRDPVPDVKTVAVHCGHCGQGLVDLLGIPRGCLFPREISNPPSLFFRPPPVASPNDFYIGWSEDHGWRWDGTTLRPTRYHLEQQQRAQQEVWAKPRAETKRLRQSLAHHGAHASGKYFARPLGKQGDPYRHREVEIIHKWAPEWIECPQCHAEVHVGPALSAHDAGGSIFPNK